MFSKNIFIWKYFLYSCYEHGLVKVSTGVRKVEKLSVAARKRQT